MASEVLYDKRTCEFQYFHHNDKQKTKHLYKNNYKSTSNERIILERFNEKKCTRTDEKKQQQKQEQQQNYYSKENSMEFCSKNDCTIQTSKWFQKHRWKIEKNFFYKSSEKNQIIQTEKLFTNINTNNIKINNTNNNVKNTTNNNNSYKCNIYKNNKTIIDNKSELCNKINGTIFEKIQYCKSKCENNEKNYTQQQRNEDFLQKMSNNNQKNRINNNTNIDGDDDNDAVCDDIYEKYYKQNDNELQCCQYKINYFNKITNNNNNELYLCEYCCCYYCCCCLLSNETTTTTKTKNIIKTNNNKYNELLSRFFTLQTIKSSKCQIKWRFYDLRKILHTLLPILLLFNFLPFLSAECDQTFVSRTGGTSNGTFSAPLLHNPTNHSRQCLYIFLAGPGQRVEVVFTTFNLRGNRPDGSAVGELPACVHEYMDIYAEVQSSDPADLINSPFGGRYCGPIPPRRRISLYRALALSFYTIKNSSLPELFGGRYTFINDSEYEMGIPVIGSPCSYTVNVSQNRTGNIISPTYPGSYPKDMSCSYQFIGKDGQRIRIEFRDFDLFFGGPHCPFDFVKVYDGPDSTYGLVGTYCGQQRNLVLYSSNSTLFVQFVTLQRTANTQNRGFKGIYEFSESFVKLDFIHENAGEHIRGSECDQKILSKKESSGFVYSPNYPYPYIPKVVCRYFIYGMQDAQHLERVKLEFSMVEIPKGQFKAETNCSDGYLKVYLKGQETTDSYDKFDYELCGSIMSLIAVSDGPRLVMVFSSGDAQGRGFKGKYSFETEYKIPGTAAPDGTCSFTYRSTSRKKGEFNSPRYPSNYPSETNCSYVFLATPNEQVVIVFDHFKVKANTTGIAYGATACYEDWLEMYILFRDGTDRFLGRYCGMTAPGPVESPRGAVGIRVLLHTDQENVASGFKARYVFEVCTFQVAKSIFGDCGGNFTGLDSGIILSPNYPSNYEGPGKGLASRTCNWFITARLGYKLSIHFEFFSVEGEPATRGCPAAVLRLWTALETDAAPLEICGEKTTTESWHHLSQGQSSRISFTTTDKTIGAQGFRIVWTEVQDSGPGPPTSIALMCESTYHFQCVSSGYCIADKLKCDGTKNCGPGDDSDEMHCTTEAPEEDHGALIISSIAAGSFLICLLCTLCHRKRKRRHHRQLGLHRNAPHYDSTTSATACLYHVTGLGSSRRHLQSGGSRSLSGSLHGIHTDSLPIPPVPLPPTSVPPHVCISGGLIGLNDDPQDDLFANGDRFSSGDSV